ncbi:hypothetical protein [Streptomyces filamentosus]|uniref:hypothetical protein n=1 Tax=Streptomyces filamentosus TaxID=67294 RepID=UPI0033EF8F17
MNPAAPLRSPVALLTALALLCGSLALVLALSTSAAAVTRHGSFAATPSSGTVAAGLASVTADGPCPAPASADEPYTKGVLVLVNPGDPTLTAPIGEVVPGGPLGTTPVSGAPVAGTGHATLQDRLRELVPSGPLDGRYELRLACETATSETRDAYFSLMIEVTGETWAAVGQQATNLVVTSDVAQPPVGLPFTVKAAVQPATATGTVAFFTLVDDEIVELGTKDLADGKAELAVTMHDSLTAPMPVLAQFTPADPAAYTPAQQVAEFYPVPVPTGTPTPTPTPTPTGTTGPTPTDTPSGTPTDDPTGEPTPTDTAGTPTATGTATPTPTATGTGDASGSDSGGDSGSGSGSGGDTGSGTGSGSGTGTGTGSGGTSPQGGSGGTLAATGAASAASAALGALALCLLGAATVLTVRRRGAGARP